MTRINTNVSSLVAQNILGRSNSSLEQALNRLSTGLRINSGKDDPAGLIASENLRSDIAAIGKAISNTERADQVIATADSSLGEVSKLLNDIRGLVTESANSGALSDDQIAANQRQIDSSLDALNRIAQTTSFQGRKLLNGSLDFITSTSDADFGNVTNLSIDQANLGSTGSVSVEVDVTTAATRAQVDVELEAAAISATGTLEFAVGAQQSTGSVTLTSGDEITITALAGGDAEGATGAANGGIDVIFVDNDDDSGTVATVVYDDVANTLTVTADFDGSAAGNPGVTSDAIAAAIEASNGGADFTASSDGTAASVAADATTYADALTGGQDATTESIDITAAAGSAGNLTITVVEANGVGATPTVTGTAATGLILTLDDTVATTISAIATALQGNAAIDVATTTSTSSYIGADDTPPGDLTLSGGFDAGDITEDLVFELLGADGAEVLSFDAGTSISTIEDAIDAVSDATGVTATVNGTTLELVSSAYGTNAFVDISVVTEGTGTTNSGTFTSSIASGERATGTDAVATVNGLGATADGNSFSINTATLDLSLSVTDGYTGTINFDITGGGALFQLGPDVVSNQQARIGISSVNTAQLGGVNGKLFQLGTGGAAALSTDPNLAASIVEEAINQVTSLRGRLGAFQRTTLETNRNALNETLVNLTDAESSIRDADFAAETAALTRAQILVQSGTAVLAIANQTPQNVLGLLR